MIPLLKSCKTKERTKHYQECITKGIPYAVFSPRKKYGSYKLDFFTAFYPALVNKPYERLRKNKEELYNTLMEVFRRTIKKWQAEQYPNFSFSYGCGELTCIDRCPVGEEDNLHKAMCEAVGTVLKAEIAGETTYNLEVISVLQVLQVTHPPLVEENNPKEGRNMTDDFTKITAPIIETLERKRRDYGEHTLAQRNFGIRLTERGFIRQRGAKGSHIWRGIDILEG